HKEFKELSKDLSQFAIKGSEDDWDSALKGTAKTLISIKTLAKRGVIEDNKRNENNGKSHKKFKKSKAKHKRN
ncbi:unnamed protein product, partial [Oppiella nova]